MRRAPAIVAAFVVAGVVYAGGNGVGSGGLNGFPPATPVTGAAINPSSVTTPFVDAGNVTVSGTVMADKFTATGVVSFETAANGRIYYGGAGGHYILANGATGTALSTGGYSGGPFYNGAGVLGALMDSPTAPTVANGCTGEAVTWHNGSANFRFDVGTSCTGITSTVITLPATTNCWTCSCFDIAADATLQQAFAGCGTTSFTISNRTRATQAATDYTDSADIQCFCRGG